MLAVLVTFGRVVPAYCKPLVVLGLQCFDELGDEVPRAGMQSRNEPLYRIPLQLLGFGGA